ncbi:zinc finger protein 385D isoform X1 [Oncorhynchus tshawytscha]|uniref:C2H2-type domain-containing protein n=2 Tax=Oncorhynchus tshawytscha TaxID=74940 RepID=A0A8C8ELU4_ONCTS|nr:zinc finger protein 385D isoform X1 [Oncorhynchus tshawytscha]
MYFGNVCQNTTMHSLARGPSANGAQTSMALKPLLPFSLFPGFSEMDRVHKMLIGPGVGLATPPMRKPSSSCVVCRLRFNSESQASSHYSGTKHFKRLKALDPLDCKTRAPDAVSKSPVSPCPVPPSSDYSSTDVTFRPVLSPPSASGVAPSTCSPAVSMETPTDPSLSPCPMVEKEKEMEGAVEEVVESEEEKAKRLLYCSLCKVAVNSASQLQAHNSGTKHKTMLEARSGDGAIKSFPRSGVKAKLAPPTEVSTGLQNKTFHCEICDVHVNSETQLKQHIKSRRHKDRVAGKPAKPKFSPYGLPPQRNQSVGIALRKEQDLAKPLASCLLQRHLSLAAAAAMATLSPFHLRPAPIPGPAIFQIQALPQTLLHPAPGPFRTAHTSVLFSPY